MTNRLTRSRLALGLALLGSMLAPLSRTQAPRPSGSHSVVATTPPLGWNSWDSYGLTISEADFRRNAAILAQKLAPYGWRYAVLDEGWYFRNPESRPHPEKLDYQLDGHGRFIPTQERFPGSRVGGATERRDGQSLILSDSQGLKPTADYLHSLGLSFGIHIIRGIPKESVRLDLPIADSTFTAKDAADTAETCPWDPTSYGVQDNAAGQAWYDSLLKQYAGWGVDFLKVDCIADHPYRGSEIRQIRRAIDKAGRPMILSLSPGPTALEHVAEVTSEAQMWRISNDVWDVWSTDKPWPISVKSQFARTAQWSAYAGPGHWPDADMLPIGQLAPKPDVGAGPRPSRLSETEQRTMLTLWAIARSPLILGANLTMLDEPTLRLLTNRTLLRIDQTATASRQVMNDGQCVAWTADLPTGETAISVFNLSDAPLNRSVRVRSGALTDVWTGAKTHGSARAITLPPHGTVLLLTQAGAGVPQVQ